MKLRVFLVADAVSLGEAGKFFVHGGGITRIEAESFPLTQPQLSVLVRLEREDEGLGTDHQLVVQVIQPDGSHLADLKTNYRIPGSADGDFPMTVNFAGGFSGLRFEQPGLYQVAIVNDEVELDRLPLLLEKPEDASKARWVSNKE